MLKIEKYKERLIMSKYLIVSGHPDLNDSVANKTILEELTKLLPEAEFDYLDKQYPDFNINVEAEQAKLENADVIVLLFPVFWCSLPSLMSRWMEQTFRHGWSHGRTGDKLKGKKLVVSLTTGAPEELYHRDAAMGYEIEDFLPPLKATANLCQMEWAGFVYTGGVSYQSRNDLEKLSLMQRKSRVHAQRIVELLKTL